MRKLHEFKLEKTNDNNVSVSKSLEKEFYNLYKTSEKIGDTWEIINKNLLLDPFDPYLNIFRNFNMDYLEKEHKWYLSKDMSIYPIMEGIKIWEFCSTKDGKGLINSNYGALVFGDENGNQFDYCFNRLKYDKNSREAMIIYTRPSIQWESQEKGKHDFVCTNYSHFFIRNNKLEMIHSQRSCDLITGLPFDFAWSCFVYQYMLYNLKETYNNLEVGHIYYNIDSLHVYTRSENLLKKYENS